MRLIKKTSFDFVSIRKTFYALSVVITIAAIFSMFYRGFNFSIDFKSGTEIALKFEKEVNVEELRTYLTTKGMEGTVRTYGENQILIKVPFEGGESTVEENLLAALKEKYADNQIEVLKVDTVGPTIARDLIRSAIYALAGALLMILVYVAFRFELKFGIAAIVATLHDVLLVAGVFSLFGGLFGAMPLEFDQSTIAALLTVAGYSITDTVVVYDRIRHNLKTRKSDRPEKIFNDSLNETLSRTIITSLTTMFSVLVLFVFAGPVIRGFAFAVGLGIIVGTYSSIFIGAPIALDMQLGDSNKANKAKQKK